MSRVMSASITAPSPADASGGAFTTSGASLMSCISNMVVAAWKGARPHDHM